MGQCVRLHADSRHGQGQGRAGARRRRHHGSRTRASQPGAAGAEHERSEHQAQARPRIAFGKGGRTADCEGPQASAQNYLLEYSNCGTGWRRRLGRHSQHTPNVLTPMHGPRKATGMIAITSRSVPAAAPTGHPVLRALLSRPRPAVMGILNVTPDSFSDGGQFIAPERAMAQARRMIAEGADIIDIGAESTRPYGAQPVSADEEMKRLRPILADVVALGVPVSIDSMKPAVVAWALDAGAAIANDVWGLQADPEMATLVAARRCQLVIMHNRDRVDPGIDIMSEVGEFFTRSLAIAAQAGILRENIALDPGIGFGKT